MLPYSMKVWCLSFDGPWTMVDLEGDRKADGYVSSEYLVDRLASSTDLLQRESATALASHGFLLPTPSRATDTAEQIKDVCDQLLRLPANTGNCSAFVKAVCQQFGVRLEGQANKMVDELTPANGWTVLGDKDAGARAAEMAALGHLVVGAKKQEGGHGHVVIVVEGPPNKGKYPVAYWGTLNHPEKAGFEKTINWAWDKNARDKVTYASREI
jgi:hypothetical protein